VVVRLNWASIWLRAAEVNCSADEIIGAPVGG